VELSPVQRRSLVMIANGFKVRKVTVEALKNKGFVEGPPNAPRLNDAGQKYVAELPTRKP
jgi:hypothetical protein